MENIKAFKLSQHDGKDSTLTTWNICCCNWIKTFY